MTSLNKDCPICKNPINARSNVVTPCNHIFCTECFFQWIKEGKSCPMCRKIFIKNETEEVREIEEARQELVEINHQIDIYYSIMNSLRSENIYLERIINDKKHELDNKKHELDNKKHELDNKKHELNIHKENLQRLQRHIDYKRDWIDLYNIKIQSHNISSRNIKSHPRVKRNWMLHNK